MIPRNTITPGASPVAPGNQGPLVDVLVWFLLVLMVLSLFVRLVIRCVLGGKRWQEDVTICVAAVCGIGQAIATSIAVSHGLGKYQNTLAEGQVASVLKAQYAADVLYLPTLCCAEIGTLQLIEWLAASDMHKMIAQYMVYFTLAWSLPSTIILAFHGGLAHPWMMQSTHPIDLHIFWIAISVLTIFTETVLVAFPLIIILPMQLRARRKMVAASAFCFRTLVLVGAAVRIAYLPAVKASTTDVTYELVGLAIATQFVLALAITTACIPSLKPFLNAFEIGKLDISLYSCGGEVLHGRSPSPGHEFGHWSKTLTQTTAKATQPIESSHHHNPRHKRSSFVNKRDSQRSDEIKIVKTTAWEVRDDEMQKSEPTSLPDP